MVEMENVDGGKQRWHDIGKGWKGRVGMVEMENVDGGKQRWHDVGKVGREEL